MVVNIVERKIDPVLHTSLGSGDAQENRRVEYVRFSTEVEGTGYFCYLN